jgi:hypothetical protein
MAGFKAIDQLGSQHQERGEIGPVKPDASISTPLGTLSLSFDRNFLRQHPFLSAMATDAGTIYSLAVGRDYNSVTGEPLSTTDKAIAAVVAGLGVVTGGKSRIFGGLRRGRSAYREVPTGGRVADDLVRAGGEPNRINSARVLVRQADEPGPFHNFPGSFDDQIFRQGQRLTVSEDYVQYTLRGTVNGRTGTFEIGVRPSASGRTEVTTHRFFRPDPSP